MLTFAEACKPTGLTIGTTYPFATSSASQYAVDGSTSDCNCGSFPGIGNASIYRGSGCYRAIPGAGSTTSGTQFFVKFDGGDCPGAPAPPPCQPSCDGTVSENRVATTVGLAGVTSAQFTIAVQNVFRGNILDQYLGCTSPNPSTGYCDRTTDELAMFYFGAITDNPARRSASLSVQFFVDSGSAPQSSAVSALGDYLSGDFFSDFQAQLATAGLSSQFPVTGVSVISSPQSPGALGPPIGPAVNPPPSPPGSSSSGLSAGAIAGIAIGAVVAVFLIVGIVYYFVRSDGESHDDCDDSSAVKGSVSTDVPSMGNDEIMDDETVKI